MRSWSLQNKIYCVLSIALMIFLSYLFLRVRAASGVPVVHSLWGRELAFLVKTISKSVELMGAAVGLITFASVVKTWQSTKRLGYAQLFQSAFLLVVSAVTPDVVAHCVPTLFGLMLY